MSIEVPGFIETILGILSFCLDKDQPQEELEAQIYDKFKELCIKSGTSVEYLTKREVSSEQCETIFRIVLDWARENYL